VGSLIIKGPQRGRGWHKFFKFVRKKEKQENVRIGKLRTFKSLGNKKPEKKDAI